MNIFNKTLLMPPNHQETAILLFNIVLNAQTTFFERLSSVRFDVCEIVY